MEEYSVNGNLRITRARERVNSGSRAQDILQNAELPTDTAFPYLEKILNASQKHPYAMLAIIVSVVGIVLAAIVTVAVTVIGGMFAMNGTLHEVVATQQVILKQQEEYRSELKVMRTYQASALSRQNFMVGMLTAEQQRRINEFDQANPLPKQLHEEKNQ